MVKPLLCQSTFSLAQLQPAFSPLYSRSSSELRRTDPYVTWAPELFYPSPTLRSLREDAAILWSGFELIRPADPARKGVGVNTLLLLAVLQVSSCAKKQLWLGQQSLVVVLRNLLIPIAGASVNLSLTNHPANSQWSCEGKIHNMIFAVTFEHVAEWRAFLRRRPWRVKFPWKCEELSESHWCGKICTAAIRGWRFQQSSRYLTFKELEFVNGIFVFPTTNHLFMGRNVTCC